MAKRSVPEWEGKTPDAKVPPRVQLRIWEREGGKCYLTGRKIMPGDAWDLDHRVALCNGGAHAESNLFPALRDKHRQKTAADVKEKARTDRLAKRAAGIRKASRMPGSRDSKFKQKIGGGVVLRATGEPVR